MSKLSVAGILAESAENWPEFDRPETRVMLGIIRLNDIVYESTRSLLAEFGLTPGAFETLMTLRGQPAPWQMTPSALYQSILMSSGGMTKVLKQLEADGLVDRVDNPEDQRSRFVRLTPAGKILAEQVMEAVAGHDRELLTGSLSDQQIEQLGKVLLKTLAKLEGGGQARM
ncbi:MAG: MarR family transcriptional regulator [Rhodobacteraceae bacterium]|jgi:DNA-binding MarR family transcriptional regulator|nr:MarR family transcriptional regulator [Paracoccaceae bacterium]